MTNQKIYTFIENHGYEIQRIITTPSCIYIELLTKNKIDPLLLRVSSSQVHPPYPFPVLAFHYPSKLNRDDSPDHDLKDEMDDYVFTTDAFIEKTYSDTQRNIQIPVNRHKIPMSQHLTETYKRQVILEDKQGEESLIQKDISRQLGRLRYCIKGMTHKLAILQSPYIGFLDDEDRVLLYQCDDSRQSQYKMYIVVDFKVFYDRLNLVENDCSQIFHGIYTILKNNQRQHSTNMRKMMDKREHMLQQIESIHQRKKSYESYIQQYTQLLDELHTYQFKKTTELQKIQEVKTDTLHNDMKRNNHIRKIEKELQEMGKIRDNLVNMITEMKNKYEQILLISDTILFDNIVLLDKIFKNFEKLETLQKL